MEPHRTKSRFSLCLQGERRLTYVLDMSTILFPSPIFGPVHSRRLGISLGVNLLPSDGKLCTFDCIYCECGFNGDHRTRSPYPTRAAVAQELETTLERMQRDGRGPDVITFAGNGEPTMHPDFAGIIEDTIALLCWYGWEPELARAAVECVCARLAESVSRAGAYESLRRDRHARALLDIPAPSWYRLLRIILGSPDASLTGTNASRGVLLRLLIGESLRHLLADVDLAVAVTVAAPGVMRGRS